MTREIPVLDFVCQLDPPSHHFVNQTLKLIGTQHSKPL